jgi:steroid delta-isomerase-like uncharacterized protein
MVLRIAYSIFRKEYGIRNTQYVPFGAVMNHTIATLVDELLDAWNNHDPDRVAAFCCPEYEGMDVSEAGMQYGPEAMRNTARRYLTAFPDLHFTGQGVVAEGDEIVLSWTAQGTHRGPLMNIPPTGRAIDLRGVSMLTLRNGKVARAFYMWDVAGMLRSIGLLPEL